MQLRQRKAFTAVNQNPLKTEFYQSDERVTVCMNTKKLGAVLENSFVRIEFWGREAKNRNSGNGR
jgi:hypothetical protein